MYAVGLNDTIWVESLQLYFGNIDSAFAIHFNAYSNGNIDTMNTHIAHLEIDLACPVAFLRKRWAEDRNGKGSFKWIKAVEDFYKDEFVAEVNVKEY